MTNNRKLQQIRDKARQKKHKREKRKARNRLRKSKKSIQLTPHDVVALVPQKKIAEQFDKDVWKMSTTTNNISDTEQKDAVLKSDRKFDRSAWKLDD